MNKSQLRLLAAEQADGQIPVSEYRARRRELIDKIVAGSETIVRVQPPQRQNGDRADETTTLDNRGVHASSGQPRTAKFRLSLPLLFAAGSALCAALLAVLLWPQADRPPARPAPPAMPRTGEISRSRALVESFVARRNFDAESTIIFKHEWQQIDLAEREQARNELWFGSLVRALRDEIKTQKALAGLAAGDDALERAKAIRAFGEFLGVRDKLPRIDDIAIPSPGETDITAATTLSNSMPEVAALPTTQAAISHSAPTATPKTDPTADPKTEPTADPTGQQWLAAQANEQLTLQIFAVNNLNRVEQLVAAHPELVVYVLATQGATPRYRVFHGVFSDEARARQAYVSLPADITSASRGAIVKSFSVVRDDLRHQTSMPAPQPERVPELSNAFTLQVFATANRNSAQALVRNFPALKLQVREIVGDPAPYRVVYGDYASAKDARAASPTLPQSLLVRIGTPLLKPVSSLGTVITP